MREAAWSVEMCRHTKAEPCDSHTKVTDTYTAAQTHAHGAMASLLTTGPKVLTAHDPSEDGVITPGAH